MNKTIVVDTNILLDDRGALLGFTDTNIVIPFVVLEELDNHKKAHGILGANARSTIRLLDELSSAGDIITGVIVEGNSTIKVIAWTSACQVQLEKHQLLDIPDNRIIASALCIKESDVNLEVNLVSNDICVRTKAKMLGLPTTAHVTGAITDSIDEVYDGVLETFADPEYINNLHAIGYADKPDGVVLHENQFVRFISNVKESHTGLGRYFEGKVIKAGEIKSVAGIRPRNLRQTLSLDVLMDPDIELVTLLGKAGTGKTLLALAAAVEQVIEKGDYEKILLVKAPVAMGPDIGFLPGELMAKILPHFESFLDNLYLLFPAYKKKSSEDLVEHLMGTGKLELLPPTYMRGRSLSNTIVIVDEVQNLKAEEVKTIATRIGEGSKLIMLGDINQVDRERLDGLHNGLTHLVEAFKDQDCAAHITFTKGERSSFADIAAEIL